MPTWENLATESYVNNHDWLSTDITDFAAAVTAFRLDQFALPTANLNLNGQRWTNSAAPVNAQDLTTKQWVLDSISGSALSVVGTTNQVNVNLTGNTATISIANNPIFLGNLAMTGDVISNTNSAGVKTAQSISLTKSGVANNPTLYFGTGANGIFWDGSNLNVTNSLLPTVNNSINLGSNSFNWANLFTNGATISGLTASQAVVTNGSKQLTSLPYTTTNTASALVQRDANQQIYCDQINLSYNNTVASSTNSPILSITNANNCFGGMKVRIGNVNGTIGARFSGYTGFASGDWFYLTYNINVDNSGTITYDNAFHRASSFYFSQLDFRFAASTSNATVPVDRLIIDINNNTVRPATNAGMALGTSSNNYSGLFTNQITFPNASVVRQQIILGNFIGNNFQFYGMGVTAGRLAFNTQASGTGFEWCYGTASSTVQIMELAGTGDLSLRQGTFQGRRSSGGYYLLSPTSTTFTSSVWAKVNGTTTSVNLNGFSHSNNRLINTTGRTIVAKITFNVTMQAVTTTTDNLQISIVKNGSTSFSDEFALSIQATRVNIGEITSLASQALISLNNNDYIEVYARSVGANRTVEFSILSVIIHEE